MSECPWAGSDAIRRPRATFALGGLLATWLLGDLRGVDASSTPGWSLIPLSLGPAIAMRAVAAAIEPGPARCAPAYSSMVHRAAYVGGSMSACRRG